MCAKLSAKSIFDNKVTQADTNTSNSTNNLSSEYAEDKETSISLENSKLNADLEKSDLSVTETDDKLEELSLTPADKLSTAHNFTILDNSLEKIRSSHKFSYEESLIFSRDKIEQLLNSLAECKETNLDFFANAIPFSDLALIPAAFSLSLYHEEIDRLNRIAMNRINYKFFEISFLIFQIYFPNPALQELLSSMCDSLIGEENKSSSNRPLFMQNSILDFANFKTNERQLLESFIDKYYQDLSNDRINNIEGFYKKYNLIDTSPFTLLLEAAIFAEGKIETIYDNKEILQDNINEYPPAAQVKIIDRIIEDESLENIEKLALYKIIRSKYFSNRDHLDIINSISDRNLNTFKLWLISDVLYLHCSGHDKKLKFLLLNIDACLDHAELGSNILALRFKDFVLISHSSISDFVIYYDNASFSRLLEENYTYEDLANPNFPIVLARQVLDAFRKNQPVRLSLNDLEKDYSRRFYDWVAGKKQSIEDAPQGIINRFFK